MFHKTFTFIAKVWLYPGRAAWHFVSVPVETTQEIDSFFVQAKRGWGSLPVLATIGETTWRTSIFPDKKTGMYLLPLKAEVRKKEKIQERDEIKVSLEIKE